MSQTITLNLPDFIYEKIKHRAEQTRRTIEDELLEMVAANVPETEELQADLAQAVAGLSFLDDKTLWQAARTHLPARSVTRIEALHNKRRNQGLDKAEESELAGLIKEYDKSILIRSEAIGILLDRGHDVSKLVKSPKA